MRSKIRTVTLSIPAWCVQLAAALRAIIWHIVDGMNLHFWMLRLMGRATCRLHESALSESYRQGSAIAWATVIRCYRRTLLHPGELMVFGFMAGQISDR